MDVYQVSSWSEMEEFYNPDDVIRAEHPDESLHSVKSIITSVRPGSRQCVYALRFMSGILFIER